LAGVEVTAAKLVVLPELLGAALTSSPAQED
jgi:hypothetical protein